MPASAKSVGFTSPLPLISFSQTKRQKIHDAPRCCVPNSVESTVGLATDAISKALQDGHTRILINALIPGLNPALEQSFPFSSSLLNTLSASLVTKTPKLQALPNSSLLFASSGTAAAATAQFRRDNPDGTTNIASASFSGRDTAEGRTSSHCNVIINPISSRGDPVMDDLQLVMSENPDATWILLNPQLGVDRAAVGMRENSRRAAFIESFTNTFYLRPLFEIQRPRLNAVERGSLLFTYGNPWKVFSLVGGQYVLADELDRMPDPEEITSCIKRCDRRCKDQPQSSATGLDVELRRLFGFLKGQ